MAVVAQQERGPQIQAAVGQGQVRMAGEHDTQRQGAAQARAQHEAEVARTVAEKAEAQTAERGRVAEESRARREEWRTEQDRAVGEANDKAGAEHTRTRGDIERKRTETDRESERRKQEDNDRIRQEREKAEEKARKERERKQRESEGILGWISSKVEQFFDALVEAVTAVFEAARRVVTGIINGFTEFVTRLIDAARDIVVGLINTLADALIKLCDGLAVFFPELAARIRRGIEEVRDAAIATVNRIADDLKAGVTALLNLLAEGLTRLLDALEAGLRAAVEVVRSAVNAAIEFARAAIQLLGEFAALVADIAPDPGGWLGKLGVAARDGIRDHLWDAVKTAVRQWFTDKVEQILGLGRAVMDVLIRGCFSMARIGRMVWEALVSALPGILVSIVIERLISLIVPAAGAVLAIVQGLVAAWGTISRIIAAIGAFMAFLKAVRSGTAAPLFAQAVATGVVALLDFVSNFLMTRLAAAAKGVGRSLRGIAQKIMRGLTRAGRGARRAAGQTVNRARQGLRAASQALRPPRARTGVGARRRPGTPTAGTRGRVAGRRDTTRRVEPARATGQRPVAGRGRPRPARPSRPTRPASPLRQRWDQMRGAVRSGLRRVRAAGRALGRRLASTRIGRALTNGARRLRDGYRRTRDRLRDRLRRRQAQRRRDHERQNSPAAKQRRLDLIVARIRPRLQRLLRMGIRGVLLRATLAALRAWYRLTRLEMGSGRAFDIRAFLNPGSEVIAGVTVDVDRLLLFVRQVSGEIVRSGMRRQRQVPAHQQVVQRPHPQTGRPNQVIPEGTPGGQVLAHFRSLPALGRGRQDVISFERAGQDPIEVRRRQPAPPRGVVPESRNRLVLMRRLFRKPRQTQEKALNYEELRLFARLTRPGQQQALAVGAMGLLRGQVPHGRYAQESAQLATWVVFQESHRNVAAAATHAMALDLVQRQRMSLPEAVRRLPMAPPGAQRAADDLHDYLVRRGTLTAKAQTLMRAEVEMIKLWVESLRDLRSLNEGTAEERERALMAQVRERLHRIYAVPADYAATHPLSVLSR
nr:hypothetical protein GCM10020241_60490 [Streptoalloteichus tenebrarius]